MDLDSLVEVRLRSPEDFLKVKETLTRIGIAKERDKRLYQSCHILHKRGKYYIVHFKELFALDGKKSSFDEDDYKRRNRIANLLDDWGLVELVDKEKTAECGTMSGIKVIPFKSKCKWELVPKYRIGND